MKTLSSVLWHVSHARCSTLVWSALMLTLALGHPTLAQAAEEARTFGTPEEAVAALGDAVKAADGDALRAIFGAAREEIENPDRVQATNEFNSFAAALGQKHRVVHESETKRVLEVGAQDWPFPVPIVRRDGRWFWDTAAGKTELLNRRIGRNELAVLRVGRAYVDAQREYARRDRDRDSVLEYAQQLASSPGARDGLFWPPDLDGEISPLGPLVAAAHRSGYHFEARAGIPKREPFHGYFFKILCRQGRHAAGGQYDYVINGNMIGGFALVAWPAEYGISGVMTFIVNQQGRVYQKDLGPNTTRRAGKMTVYDPDPTWAMSRE